MTFWNNSGFGRKGKLKARPSLIHHVCCGHQCPNSAWSALTVFWLKKSTRLPPDWHELTSTSYSTALNYPRYAVYGLWWLRTNQPCTRSPNSPHDVGTSVHCAWSTQAVLWLKRATRLPPGRHELISAVIQRHWIFLAMLFKATNQPCT